MKHQAKSALSHVYLGSPAQAWGPKILENPRHKAKSIGSQAIVPSAPPMTGRPRWPSRGTLPAMDIKLSILTEREDDGRWIGEVPDLPGALVYGQSREEAITSVKALALEVLADRLRHGESAPGVALIFQVP